MTYQETIKYLESFINYEKLTSYPYKESLKLERFRQFLPRINNPHQSLRCIHVAGSKGKGSTCVFIAYILKEAGFHTGLYTSPHLSDFRERIRILRPGKNSQTPPLEFEGMISKEELAGLVEKIKPAIKAYNRTSKYGPLSFFEVYTAIAFLYFKNKKTDFIVLETGLGGRLDATNVVPSLVQVITPISYEHTQKLGSTLRQIAMEKAGIIKGQGFGYRPLVISAPQETEVLQVIKEKAKKHKGKFYLVGREILYKEKGNRFEVRGIFEKYKNLKIKLLGEHQLINAACAAAAVEALQFYSVKVAADSLRKGLCATLWPGRCEIAWRNPLVILDGAQNVASCKALVRAIQGIFSYRKIILVLGMSDDKDAKGVCSCLSDLSSTIILTRADTPRAKNPAELAWYFKDKVVYSTDNVAVAARIAFSLSHRRDLILVTGSLFVVGEMRRELLFRQ